MADFGNAWQSHARKLRAAGWATQRIAEQVGKSYGTTYAAVRDVKPAKRGRQLVPISGQARLHEWDDAEKWLRENDSEYSPYQVPSTDVLSHIYSGNETHPMLAELQSMPITDHEPGESSTSASTWANEYDSHGNYRRALAADSDDAYDEEN